MQLGRTKILVETVLDVFTGTGSGLTLRNTELWCQEVLADVTAASFREPVCTVVLEKLSLRDLS
jgi:hypothetical protein